MRTQVSRRRACHARDLCDEGIALDYTALRHLENFATPENDSFMEEFAAIIRDFNVPRTRVRSALKHYKAFRELHDAEIDNYRRLNNILAGLDGASVETGTLQAFTGRGLVATLGEPLMILADARRGRPIDGAMVEEAWARVLDAARAAPPELLHNDWVRSRLRGRRSAELDRAIAAAA